MVSELADARARLIDWSKGEIRTQYERLNAAINSMPLGLCMFDAEHKLIVCNHAMPRSKNTRARARRWKPS